LLLCDLEKIKISDFLVLVFGFFETLRGAHLATTRRRRSRTAAAWRMRWSHAAIGLKSSDFLN
jgi:hypothetical protein